MSKTLVAIAVAATFAAMARQTVRKGRTVIRVMMMCSKGHQSLPYLRSGRQAFLLTIARSNLIGSLEMMLFW